MPEYLLSILFSKLVCSFLGFLKIFLVLPFCLAKEMSRPAQYSHDDFADQSAGAESVSEV